MIPQKYEGMDNKDPEELLEQLKESFDKDKNSPKEKSWFENARDFMRGQ